MLPKLDTSITVALIMTVIPGLFLVFAKLIDSLRKQRPKKKSRIDEVISSYEKIIKTLQSENQRLSDSNIKLQSENDHLRDLLNNRK